MRGRESRKYPGALQGPVPFCEMCKAMVYPQDGKLKCRKCGWSSEGPAESRIVRTEASSRERVVLERKEEARPQQTITCPKCGHDKAFFHLMQTRKSDEPPTQINECVSCKHSWREY